MRPRTRAPPRTSRASAAAQRSHLLLELLALGRHLVECRAVAAHDVLRRALNVLGVAQSLLARHDLLLERFELSAQPLTLLRDVDQSRERHDDLRPSPQHGVRGRSGRRTAEPYLRA